MAKTEKFEGFIVLLEWNEKKLYEEKKDVNENEGPSLSVYH